MAMGVPGSMGWAALRACVASVLGWIPWGGHPDVPVAWSGRSPTNTFEVQLALGWRGFRSGPVDGIAGPQTRAALMAFQRDEGLPMTGRVDAPVLARLRLDEPPSREHTVTREDRESLGRVPPTWRGKAHASRLPYESLLEAMAERSGAHPRLVREWNPGVDWGRAGAGTRLRLPRFRNPPVRPASMATIHLAGRTLQAVDAAGRIILHAPCSIGRGSAARPRGRLRVGRIVQDPTYHFDPERFPESEEARGMTEGMVLPPGPNNPVGVAWIGLDLPGHGIHGTPWPEKVGRTESHGCFRLANWDAAFLAQIAWVGMEVEVTAGTGAGN